MTYIVTRDAFDDIDYYYEEFTEYAPAKKTYDDLLPAFDKDKHLYLEFSKVDETQYTPKPQTLAIKQPA
jgi:hypothetical protein